MCDRINLPRTITDRANALFKKVHDGKNLRGRSNDAISSACLYIACRQEGVPRTFKEIVAVSTVSKKEIGRCFKLILKAHKLIGSSHKRSLLLVTLWTDFVEPLGLPEISKKLPLPLPKGLLIWTWYLDDLQFQLRQPPFIWQLRLKMTRNLNGKYQILLV